MLRFFFLAVASVVIVSVGYLVLPRGGGRPDAHLATTAATPPPDPSAFVVHDAPVAPPVPPPPARPVEPAAPARTVSAEPNPPAGPDLDAVLQRLRNSAPLPAAPVSAPAPPPAPPIETPPPPLPVIVPSPPPGPLVAPASRWSSVTGQGVRWRMTPSRTGYTVSIDLGGGRVADVHVAPAFAGLDQVAMSQRVDYLRTTILQNFPPESASYTFARDGSVSLDP